MPGKLRAHKRAYKRRTPVTAGYPLPTPRKRRQEVIAQPMTPHPFFPQAQRGRDTFTADHVVTIHRQAGSYYQQELSENLKGRTVPV